MYHLRSDLANGLPQKAGVGIAEAEQPAPLLGQLARLFREVGAGPRLQVAVVHLHQRNYYY